MLAADSAISADRAAAHHVGSIAASLDTLRPSMTCQQVFNWFEERPDQPVAAITDESGSIHGLVNRLKFLSRYSQRYVPELFGRRPIEALAVGDPLTVDEKLSVAQLGAVLAQTPEFLLDGFVITRNGRYLGIGTGAALVRAKLQLLLETEADLRLAMAKALESNKTRDTFLALMSHELRTPLNAIIGFSEVLKTEMFGPLGSAKNLDYINDINAAGRHLLALINDILDVSRADAGKMELNEETFDFSAVVADCLKLSNQRARENDIALTADIPADLPLLNADKLRVKQILLNLVTNAIKFTPAGGRVGIGAQLGSDGRFIFSVADNGAGMAPEMIPLALEPFQRIGSPFIRQVEGTGLGLPLAKSLAEQHGGELTIESRLGEGTTVRIAFPKHRAVVQSQAARA